MPGNIRRRRTRVAKPMLDERGPSSPAEPDLSRFNERRL
jgi:hypothetical protein